MAYEMFLGVSVASSDVLIPYQHRAKYLSPPARHQHIFLDPDKGIKIKQSTGLDSVKYVFGPELVKLCNQVPERLLLVFDQSIPNGLPDDKREYIAKKLDYFRGQGIFGFAYRSHACFLVLSSSELTCRAARDHLLESHLPKSRLVVKEGL